MQQRLCGAREDSWTWIGLQPEMAYSVSLTCSSFTALLGLDEVCLYRRKFHALEAHHVMDHTRFFSVEEEPFKIRLEIQSEIIQTDCWQQDQSLYLNFVSASLKAGLAEADFAKALPCHYFKFYLFLLICIFGSMGALEKPRGAWLMRYQADRWSNFGYEPWQLTWIWARYAVDAMSATF